MKDQKGFTLVELMIVIAILGILAAIVIPAIDSSISTKKANQNLSTEERINVDKLSKYLSTYDGEVRKWSINKIGKFNTNSYGVFKFCVEGNNILLISSQDGLAMTNLKNNCNGLKTKLSNPANENNEEVDNDYIKLDY